MDGSTSAPTPASPWSSTSGAGSPENAWMTMALLEQGYPALFPKARRAPRQWKALLGPTNSGKTYQALQSLKAAHRGLYLAPLRLLALEVYEKLTEEGVPCNLLTGEEKIIVEGARHTAATIESGVNLGEFDEVVIDEIQLMHEPQRGWAWVQALLGMDAPLIWLAGSADVEDHLQWLADAVGDSLEVIHVERKCPLHVEFKPITLKDVKAGDAVIAFSRRDVLAVKEALWKDQELKASCIYGALGPTARRDQASKFRDGDHPAVVATDAIGLGLNLPIARVVFTSLMKYDGQEDRPLTDYEIRQIAGRAGRYGLHQEGAVTALSKSDLNHIQAVLRKPIKVQGVPEKGMTLMVRPPLEWVEQAAPAVQGRLTPLFYRFERDVEKMRWSEKEHPVSFMLSLDSEARKWLSRIDPLPLSVRDKFTLLGCPVQPNTEDDIYGWVLNQANLRVNRLPTTMQAVVKIQLAEDGPSAASNLQSLETMSALARSYNWLALHFPEIYVEGELAKEVSEALQIKISRLLTKKIQVKVCKSCGVSLPTFFRHPKCEDCFELEKQYRDYHADIGAWQRHAPPVRKAPAIPRAETGSPVSRTSKKEKEAEKKRRRLSEKAQLQQQVDAALLGQVPRPGSNKKSSGT